MFVTTRKYSPTSALSMKVAMGQMRDVLQQKFLPLIQDIPGFHGYYAINVEDRELITIGVFETRSGAEESTRRAAKFTKETPLPMDIGRPEVTSGEVLVLAEAERLAGSR